MSGWSYKPYWYKNLDLKNYTGPADSAFTDCKWLLETVNQLITCIYNITRYSTQEI